MGEEWNTLREKVLKFRFFFLCSHCCNYQQINVDIISKLYSILNISVLILEISEVCCWVFNECGSRRKQGRWQSINYVLCMKNWVNHRRFMLNNPLSQSLPSNLLSLQLKIKSFQKRLLKPNAAKFTGHGEMENKKWRLIVLLNPHVAAQRWEFSVFTPLVFLYREHLFFLSPSSKHFILYPSKLLHNSKD